MVINFIGRPFILAALFAVSLGSSALAEQEIIQPFNGNDLTGWLTKGGTPEQTLKVGTAALDPQDARELVVKPGGSDLRNAGSFNATADRASSIRSVQLLAITPVVMCSEISSLEVASWTRPRGM